MQVRVATARLGRERIAGQQLILDPLQTPVQIWQHVESRQGQQSSAIQQVPHRFAQAC